MEQHPATSIYNSMAIEETCAATSAAEGGSIHVLEWLREECCELKDRLCSDAALHGQIETLQVSECIIDYAYNYKFARFGRNL